MTSDALAAGLKAMALRGELDTAAIFDAGDDILAGAGDAAGGHVRLAVVGDLTMDFVARAAAVGALLEGDRPRVYVAPFGSLWQECLDDAAALTAFAPNVVLIVPDWRAALDDPFEAQPAENSDAQVERHLALCEALRSRLGCRVILQNLVPAPIDLGGVADRRRLSSPRARIRAFNDRLVQAASAGPTLLDVEALAERIGTQAFASERSYRSARLPFDTRYLPDYLTAFRSAWRRVRGNRKKVLVVDLDNTLWGGVVGDDGVEGIALGAGSPIGEAFLDWQRYIAALGKRGVVLAVCSKNEEEIALAGLRHPASALPPEAFAATAISWGDKASGLRDIARQLNLGVESFVFCDDNPAECSMVSRELPEVETIHLGTDPSRFIEIVEGGHWFETDAYLDEDYRRETLYASRRLGLAANEGRVDMASYLRGLEMIGEIRPLQAADLPRCAQLEMKTNQFNVTTRRYCEADLAAFIAREDSICLTLRLADRFGDHGLVSSLVAIRDGGGMRIDSWLMSCRVFSRTCEDFMMEALVGAVADRGCTHILGEYRPTAKNAVVAGLFARLGFVVDEDLWRLELPRTHQSTSYISAQTRV